MEHKPAVCVSVFAPFDVISKYFTPGWQVLLLLLLLFTKKNRFFENVTVLGPLNTISLNTRICRNVTPVLSEDQVYTLKKPLSSKVMLENPSLMIRQHQVI